MACHFFYFWLFQATAVALGPIIIIIAISAHNITILLMRRMMLLHRHLMALNLLKQSQVV